MFNFISIAIVFFLTIRSRDNGFCVLCRSLLEVAHLLNIIAWYYSRALNPPFT